MPQPTVRVPGDVYEKLREIMLSLEVQYRSAAPSMQDLVTIALKHFINNWENPQLQSTILSELVESRKIARLKMGKKRLDAD